MRASGRREGGQAAVELVCVMPFLVLLAMLLWQMAVAGQAAWLSGAAARAAARAHAVGGDPTQAARGVLPARLEQGLRVTPEEDGRVRVVLAVPSVLGTGSLGAIDGRARFEPQGGR